MQPEVAYFFKISTYYIFEMPIQSKPIKNTMPESDEQVQKEVEERTGTRPCIWQIKVVRKVHASCHGFAMSARPCHIALCHVHWLERRVFG